MKKVFLLAVFFVFLFQAAAFAEIKIATFDAKGIVARCEYGKEVKAKLDTKFKERGEQLKKEREGIAKLKTQIESKAFDEKTIQDKVLELRRRGRDWNEDFTVYQKSIQAEQNKLAKPIIVKLEQVVLKYCKEQGFTIVFDRQMPGIVYTADGIDITDALIKQLDAMKKAGK